jgi:hypothetical protein
MTSATFLITQSFTDSASRAQLPPPPRSTILPPTQQLLQTSLVLYKQPLESGPVDSSFGPAPELFPSNALQIFFTSFAHVLLVVAVSTYFLFAPVSILSFFAITIAIST